MTQKILEHGSLYVCLVTSPVICRVQIRVVINSNVCPCVGLVKLHCRLISTPENFPQERTALELTTLALCNFHSVTILRRVFLGAYWPFYITKDLM
jgi:folylpolyglutamate synthase/dihydropteroate synthase